MSKISLKPKAEEALIKKAQRRKNAFAPLYKHYFPHIKRYFSRKIATPEDIEDLTAKVFEKALLGIDNFQWQGVSFSAWLYRISRHCLIDYYRAQTKKRERTETASPKNLLVSKDKNPEEETLRREQQKELHQLLLGLPTKERSIIYMKFFEGYTNKTIARLSGLSETNVGTIIYRTVKKLRKMLMRTAPNQPPR